MNSVSRIDTIATTDRNWNWTTTVEIPNAMTASTAPSASASDRHDPGGLVERPPARTT
jgi:hypothetical protein